MIVVTTPTGNVGSQLLAELLKAETEPLRVIVRDPSRMPGAVRDQVQVIVGSHDDPAVLDQALDGAQGLFWLIPPSMRASSAKDYYCPPPLIRCRSRESDSRICSAVLVQINGLGFSFHAATQLRMSFSSAWTLRWSERRSRSSVR